MLDQFRKTQWFRLRVSFVAITFVMGSYVSASLAAEDELTQKLVGKWEGVLLVKKNNYRTLVIQSVKPDGDQWVANGRYGLTDTTGRPVRLKITPNGDTVIIDFDTPQNDPVRLKLENGNSLNGYVRFSPEGKHQTNIHLNLKKVE